MTDLRPALARLPILAAAALAVALATAPPADAASKSCSRGGGTILAASAKTRVVSIPNRPQNSETRRDHILGCRVPTGRRFELFFSRSFGLDLIEHDHFEIVGDRYIGFIRDFEGGASESQSAAVFDAFTRRKTHDSALCDKVDTGDFSGIEDAAFLPRGGLAYSCGQLRLADAKGDRQLEPPGTDVRNLGVSANARGFNARLYWLVVSGATQTPKSLDLGVF